MQAAVLVMPWSVRVAAEAREMVRQVAERLGVQRPNRWAWVAAAALLYTVLIGTLSFVRTLGRGEGVQEVTNKQVVASVDALSSVVSAMRGELLGEVAQIRGSVGAQQRQVDRLEAEMHAAMEAKDREITRLEGQVQTALAYAQSADKNIARLQERMARNGG